MSFSVDVNSPLGKIGSAVGLGRKENEDDNKVTLAIHKKIRVESTSHESIPDDILENIVKQFPGTNYLPSPLYIPRVYYLDGSEELAERIRQTLGDRAKVEFEQLDD
ncbi:hypothetical protein FSARC_11159 [Fusarium sarcochroum]|uniref:Uncharacterized protein n=1 Tax=Fusarium sarcochroum TaxID=1208366 RepID=A0A8H4THA5_9HYPO|nr:hypothetical protein FSARC_11159 [Fusarium sarcochroum]